jgi:hypothetical protein
MAKRKDFVSDGLMTLRHKFVAEELNALKGDDDVSAAYKTSGIDKNLSIQEQQAQIYHQIKDDLNIRLHEELAELETQIDLEKNDLKKCEDAYERFQKVLEKFSSMPKSTEIEKDSEALARLEQLRVEFFSAKAARERRAEVSPINNSPAGTPQISLVPEMNSLHQMQMMKMGLFFALPVIVGVIIGCAIIAWAIVLTLGR